MKPLLTPSLFCLLLLTGGLFYCQSSTTDTPMNTPTSKPGFYVDGRFLHDPCGNKITLRGINKMNVWTDRAGDSFAEIARTGANCVRIVWLATDDVTKQPTKAADLDNLITKCVAQQMIPIVEVHDATGDWSKLGAMVDYWKRPDILAVIKKHERYLLVNIANECGNDQVKDDQFIAGYSQAVQQLRQAGIHTPLVIDGTDFGKNLDQLVRVGPSVIQADPDRNLLFSVHTYWPATDGATPDFIRNQFQTAVDAGLPFIVGEFAAYGAYAGEHQSLCGPNGRVDYQTIVSEAQRLDIGWLAWEWGPGNAVNDSLCAVMDMTTNSTFATLKGWGKEIALTSPGSIQKTAVRSPFLLNGMTCK